MAYNRSEYRREDRGSQDREGGWRSWFGLGSNKDEDRGYSYQRTSTYRAGEPERVGQYSGSYDRPAFQTSSGDRDRYISGSGAYASGTGDRYGAVSGAGTFGGERGGYGYQTSGEYSSRLGGPSYDRYPTSGDYSYKGPGLDRDYNRDGGYYRSETRSYGADRDIPSRFDSRYGGDSDRIGYGGDSYVRGASYGADRVPSRGYVAGLSGDYSSGRGAFDRDRDYTSYERTGTLGGSGYRGGYDSGYDSSRNLGYSGAGDYSRAGTYGGYSSSRY